MTCWTRFCNVIRPIYGIGKEKLLNSWIHSGLWEKLGILIAGSETRLQVRIDSTPICTSSVSAMNINDFFSQATEYESEGDLLGASHPFPVLRLSELKTWPDSGSYDRILSGGYKRRHRRRIS
ncbi:MAG TPA: hypothetical protein ENI07_07450 [Desulfobacterales bacterium]|nr:hypothetical protein [Desulfobacterales bacterium]